MSWLSVAKEGWWGLSGCEKLDEFNFVWRIRNWGLRFDEKVYEIYERFMTKKHQFSKIDNWHHGRVVIAPRLRESSK
jgi:hypothetical protein